MSFQPSLFDLEDAAAPAPADLLPQGLSYHPDVLDGYEEHRLVTAMAALPFAPLQGRSNSRLGRRDFRHVDKSSS